MASSSNSPPLLLPPLTEKEKRQMRDTHQLNYPKIRELIEKYINVLKLIKLCAMNVAVVGNQSQARVAW